jgi:hypothetical protein
VREAAEWSILALREECTAAAPCPETQLATLAAVVVAARALPLPGRIESALEFAADAVRGLPPTTMAPAGIVSAGLLVEIGSAGNGGQGGGNRGAAMMAQYRKPARPALWAELALSLLVDGPPEAGRDGGDASGVRSRGLAKFLKSSTVVAILNDGGSGSARMIREEFVLAFCTVAFRVGRGRRSCHDEVVEWIRMSLALLNAFGPCVGWGESQLYMEEELTMLVAGQAAYTQLLQEVLHAAGLLGPTSVSMKMTPFASPPHIMWDQMEESAEYLVQLDSVAPPECMIDPVGRLMDDIVRRDMKGQGIVSHHMRLFLMTLAADQWVEARCTLAKRARGSGAGVTDVDVNVDSAKQILVAISPRRMFSKVVESNKSQVDSYSKSKKERYKKFAQDTVTACVACIENMALMACHWKSEFGNSNDTKTVLNLAVQSLQGKTGNDGDAPVLPVCQGAIERIQSAFQTNDSIRWESISMSTLVPREFKRRQIISSSRISQGRDAFNGAYLMQLSRQIISFRAEMCLLSNPTVSAFPGPARKRNWLRLSLPPLPPSRNPQESTSRIPRFAFGSNVSACTAGSDAAAVALAYSLRRNLRYDGQEEFRLMVAVRVHNVTAVDVPSGLRLELGITEDSVATSPDAQDGTSLDILKSLTEGFEDVARESSFSSAVAIYRNDVKSGDHITWELLLSPLSMTGAINLRPTIMYCGMEEEPPAAFWVTADSKKEDEDTSVTSGLSFKSGGSKNGGEGEGSHNKQGSDRRQNIVIPGETMQLPLLIGLQPCPLVFFQDGRGDVDSFRFLWSRMPCQTSPLKLTAPPHGEPAPSVSYDAMRLAAISTVAFGGDHVSGGQVSHLWAFLNPHGKRAMFVLAEQGSDKTKLLHARGDDKQLLLCLTGTSSARQALVAALQPGLVPLG